MISNREQLAALREARKIVRDRAGRVRLLRAELDVQGTRSIERTKTVEAKASFVVTAAALVAGASIGLLPANPFTALSLVLAAAAVFYAAQAAKPLTLDVPSARDLVDEYLNAALTVEELEDTLLEVRTVEIEKRDEVTKTRARAMTLGFRFLVASVITLVMIAALGALPTGGLPTDDERELPGTTATEAP